MARLRDGAVELNRDVYRLETNQHARIGNFISLY